jgi:hypothetical protein
MILARDWEEPDWDEPVDVVFVDWIAARVLSIVLCSVPTTARTTSAKDSRRGINGCGDVGDVGAGQWYALSSVLDCAASFKKAGVKLVLPLLPLFPLLPRTLPASTVIA